MAQNYYEKQSARIEYYENKIKELREEHSHYVGGYTLHNIEKVAKIENQIRFYEDKVKAIKNNRAINADNPDAIDLLELKLEQKKERHAFIKLYNAKVRKYKSKGEKTDFTGFSDSQIQNIKAGIAVPTYHLTYLTREIRDLTKKIEKLKKLASDTTKETDYGKFKVIDNVEENRVQVFLDEETGRKLYRDFRSWGFVFSRTNGAWQRKRGNAGYATKNIVNILTEYYKSKAS